MVTNGIQEFEMELRMMERYQNKYLPFTFANK